MSKTKIDEDYKLIPMSEITDEARLLAVAWMDCEDKRWIGNKHKLASDIMNYARRYHDSFGEAEGMREALESLWDDIDAALQTDPANSALQNAMKTLTTALKSQNSAASPKEGEGEK